VYLNIFGRPLVIINSHKVAVDLLEKRSRIYSGRPVSKMVKLYELLPLEKRTSDPIHCSSGMGDALFFSTYNDRLKRLRRALARALSSDVVKRDFRPLMEIEIRDCMEDMLLNPSDFDKHLKRMVAAVIMKLVYGYELKKENDPFEDLAHNALTKFSLISRSGAWLVDVISIRESRFFDIVECNADA
jgi:cytochrome P450